MNKLKTAVVTTSRADYGLLYPLIKKMSEDDFFHTGIIATGSHLSPLHGLTSDIVKEQSCCEYSEIDTYSGSDTETGICNSIASGLTGASRLLSQKKPDLIIVLGDRYELWPVCMASVIHKVPIAHIHGGETTIGSTDEAVRHSVTKMAAIHFPSIEQYAARIIQMGEDPKRVFTVGALGLDNIKDIESMNSDELNEYTGLDFNNNVALMTYHPATLDEYASSSNQVREILNALLETGLVTLVTMPNADVGGLKIYDEIIKYVNEYPVKFKLVKNMGQIAYLSAMKYAGLMIGNSSSGIIESASFKLPVVNVGDRQGGRFKPPNVIDCGCSKEEILKSIGKALSVGFKKSISGLENPYGDGNTSDRIINILKSINFRDGSKLLNKKFYDFNIN